MSAHPFRSPAALLATAAMAALCWCSPVAAQTELKVSLNAPYDGSNAAFFLAEEKGYYAAEGLKPSFDPSGGSGEAVTRIGSGTYDFGFGDINVLMEFNAKNPANAGRAVYMLYYRSPLSVGTFAKNNISKPADLDGKKIGGALTDGAYKLFPAYAKLASINAGSIQWQFGDLRLREALLLKGDVDAILGFDSTMYFNFVRQGIAPTDIKFLYYSDAGLNIYGNAILASKKILDGNPEGRARLRRGLRQGLARRDREPRRRHRGAEEAFEPGGREARTVEARVADQEPARDGRVEGRWAGWRERGPVRGVLGHGRIGVRTAQDAHGGRRVHGRIPAGRGDPQAAVTGECSRSSTSRTSA